VTAVLFLFAFSLIQGLISDFAQIEPWFILTYGSGIIGNVLTVPYPTVPAGRFAITPYVVTIPEGLVIIGAYFIVTAALGLLLFEKKEFN
jgi:hypothetical protein